MEKRQYEGDVMEAPMPGQHARYGETTEPRSRRFDPARAKELFSLALDIATLVDARVRPGPDRGRLRVMVEMLLND